MFALVVFVAPYGGLARAEGLITGRIDRIANDFLVAEGVEWQLLQEAKLTRLDVHARAVAVAGLTFSEVDLNCATLILMPDTWSCGSGHLSAGSSFELDLTVTGNEQGLIATIDSSRIGLDWLSGQLAGQLASALTIYGGNLLLSGELEIRKTIQARLEGRIEALAFDSDSGTRAGDGLGLAWQADFTVDNDQVAFKVQARELVGELLLGDLYLDFSGIPDLSVSTSGIRKTGGELSINRLDVNDDGALNLAAAVEFGSDGAATSFDVSRVELEFPWAYQRYLAPLAEARGFGAMAMEGRLAGAFAVNDGDLSRVELHLDQLAIDDGAGRFQVIGLDGQLTLSDGPSTVKWSSASLYAVPMAAGVLQLAWTPMQIELLEPTRLGLLGGALVVDRFVISGVGESRNLEFEGAIEPVSLLDLTRALEWPEFSGSLSGQIPRVSLSDGVVAVDGDIQIDVFDGRAVLGGLRLERLFGVLPTLAADIAVDDIDLELLTGAFSFGRIEGRLDGEVSGLRLLDWQPVAFDLRLATDPDAPGKRRISQRAVDNLSSIGGGATAAISQTFLRVFDDFGYKRLGLSCRLMDNVCRMSGVGETGKNRGYYIVEGSGLPRIDVVGYSTKVDWPQLLRRLDAATRSAPAID